MLMLMRACYCTQAVYYTVPAITLVYVAPWLFLHHCHVLISMYCLCLAVDDDERKPMILFRYFVNLFMVFLLLCLPPYTAPVSRSLVDRFFIHTCMFHLLEHSSRVQVSGNELSDYDMAKEVGQCVELIKISHLNSLSSRSCTFSRR